MMVAEHPTSGVSRDILGPMHRLWCFLFELDLLCREGHVGAGLSQRPHAQRR